MFNTLVPLNKERHQLHKVQPINNFKFASDFHIATVMVHEFTKAAASFPIVFLENTEKDLFYPVVMLGLEPNQNLFVAESGDWNASYVPAVIRRYPFALARLTDDETFTVCIDEGSDLVGIETGAALFDDQGEPTEIIDNVKSYLSELQQMEVFTGAFCAYLAEHNLFTPMNMQVRVKDKLQNITGCYVINEQRLNAFSNERFIEIREKNYLAPIYSHLTSLARTQNLAMLKEGVEGVTVEDAAAAEKEDDPMH